MLTICAIDPGVSYHAVAVFAGDQLIRAELAPALMPIADLYYIEKPAVYSGKEKFKGDIVDLAIAVGQLKQICGPERTTLVTVAEWKGQTPKKISQERVLAKLSDAEKYWLPKKKKELVHVLDAVGIGLYKLHR